VDTNFKREERGKSPLRELKPIKPDFGTRVQIPGNKNRLKKGKREKGFEKKG